MPSQTFDPLGLSEHRTSQPMSSATSLTAQGPSHPHSATPTRHMGISEGRQPAAAQGSAAPGRSRGCTRGLLAQLDTAWLGCLSVTQHILGFLAKFSSIPMTQHRGLSLSFPPVSHQIMEDSAGRFRKHPIRTSGFQRRSQAVFPALRLFTSEVGPQIQGHGLPSPPIRSKQRQESPHRAGQSLGPK